MKLTEKYKGWKIYQTGQGDYAAFLPGQSPRAFNEPEWITDQVWELKDFVDCY
ncbi:MAG: hypothetical protein VB085_08685 [Peptococcaceae bacterium]|nr:hypothetical protein [Peptococcaceae bacterium]